MLLLFSIRVARKSHVCGRPAHLVSRAFARPRCAVGRASDS